MARTVARVGELVVVELAAGVKAHRHPQDGANGANEEKDGSLGRDRSKGEREGKACDGEANQPYEGSHYADASLLSETTGGIHDQTLPLRAVPVIARADDLCGGRGWRRGRRQAHGLDQHIDEDEHDFEINRIGY